MADRAPLAGWRTGAGNLATILDLGAYLYGVVPFSLGGPLRWAICVQTDDADEVRLIRGKAISREAAVIAAEDAARALVAEMAAALGGRVTWGPVCPFCNFQGDDVEVDGQMECAGCGALGAPTANRDSEGATDA